MNKWIHLIHNKLINTQGWRVTKLPRRASRTSQAVGRPPVYWGTPVSPSRWTPGKGSRRRDLARSHRVEPHSASLVWQVLSGSTGEASSAQSVSLHRLGFPNCFVIILEIAIKYLNCTESVKEITSALLQLPSLLWFLSLKYFYLHGNKFFKVKLVFCVCVCVCVKLLSCVWLFVIPWSVAYQAPPSMEFSRQEYWIGLPFPSLGDLPDLWIEPRSPALQADVSPSEPPGKALYFIQ